MTETYAPPMPGTATPKAKAKSDSASGRRRPDSVSEKTQEFPRATPEEKAQFAEDFGGKARTAPKTKRATPPQIRKIESKLEELFSALSLPFMLAGDTHCANIIAQGAPGMAEAWANLADENPGVKRVLTKLTEGSAWGAVILSTASVAVPIAAHHGVPMGPAGSLFGSSPLSTGQESRVPPSPTPSTAGSAMGAPATPDKPRAMDPNYKPSGAPDGVVLVGERNMAGANGANGMAAHQ